MNIIRSENTCFGRPRIDGTRLEVYTVITDLFYADSIEEVVKDRGLSHDDLQKVVDYCRNMDCKIITKSYEKYCSGCILSTQHEGLYQQPLKLQKLDGDLYIDEQNNAIFVGSKEELEEELYGKPGWIIAAQVYEKWME